MKRIIICLILMVAGFFMNASSVKVISSVGELEKTVINCHTDYSMIIELPKNTMITNAFFDKMSKKQWNVDFDFNLVWLQPKYFDSENSILRVSIRGFKDILFKLSSVEKPEGLLHTMIIKDGALEPVTIRKPGEIKSDQINSGEIFGKKDNEGINRNSIVVKDTELSKVEKRAKEVLKDPEAKNNEHRVSLSGGLFNGGDKNSFSVQGEYVGAFKFGHGIITQGAILLNLNSYQQKYGVSAGIGVEQKNIGAFIFADTIFYKVNDLDTTFHFQVRPSTRLTFDNLQIAGFIGIPLSSPGFTGVTVQENGETLGIYNKALLNAGLQIKAFFNKTYTEFKTLMAGKGVYSVTVRVGYEILKNIVMTAEFNQSSAGEYAYIDGFSKNSSVMLSGRYYFGKANPVTNRIEKTLIFDPSYPVIVQVKKVPEASDVSINLVANPTEGFALLAVDFTATPSGFTGNVDYKWQYTPVSSGETTSPVSNFTYTTPGTYQAYVEGTDEKGNYAKSNTVTIIVKLNTDPDAKYSIKATCSEGGYIQPCGETTAKSGNTVSIAFGGNDGYGVTKVIVDGSEVTSLSSPFVFKNIQSNHTIHVDFAAGAVPQYTIESSVKSGSGTITPLGTTTVNEGASQSYSITPASGWSILRVIVDGEPVGAPTTYVFENVKASHVIKCEFSENPPTLYEIDATSGANGSISPSGKTSVVQGDSITFTLTPDPGYEIDVLKVDGSSTSPNEGSDKYKFSNVNANHTINITFKRIILHVTTSVTAGEGTITESSDVYWGDDFTVTSTPVESHQVKDLVVNGGSVGQVGEITLNQIKTDQTVAVEFEIKKFTITASVRNNQWGTISPGTVEVEWGTDKSFTFSPESNKEVRRYWVNGGIQGVAGSYTFNDVKVDKTIEVEFQWIKYDVGVTLELEDSDTHGHINPGTGWFEYNAGESPRFDFITEEGSEIEYVRVNNNNQGKPDYYRIDEINKDYTIDVKMKRIDIPVNAMWIYGTCDVNVTTNQGHSGMFNEYEVKYGDSLTFYFDIPAHLSGIKDFYLNTSKGYQGFLPDQFTFNNIIDEGEWIHVKCVNKGDPPPF